MSEKNVTDLSSGELPGLARTLETTPAASEDVRERAVRLLGLAMERAELLCRDAGRAEWPLSDFSRDMLQARLDTVRDLIGDALAALRSAPPGVEEGEDMAGDGLVRSLCRSLIGRIMEASDPDTVGDPGDVGLRLESIIRERDRLRAAPVPAREGEDIEGAIRSVLDRYEYEFDTGTFSPQQVEALPREIAARLRGEGGGE